MKAAVTNDLDRRALAILKANDQGGYTVPTHGLYPFQWNWDSAFVALGFASFDAERAWREIETLLAAQWEDGFVPHIVFWKDDSGYFPGPSVWRTRRHPATSGITQPPVAASVARWLYEAQGEAALVQVRRLFPKLLAWHRWFHECRDTLGKGLVLATHPWETGRDNSAEWDRPMSAVDISRVEPYERRDLMKVDADMRPTKENYDRYLAILQWGRDCAWDHRAIAREGPFRVVDIGMTTILLRADRDLLVLAELLGEMEHADYLRKRISLAEAGIAFLWNDDVGAFCSYDLVAGQSLPYLTSASFLAFFAGAGSASERARLIAHLERISGKARYLVPSLDVDHPDFDPIRYWRGPVWAMVNFLVARGLMEAGYPDWAERLRRDTETLIAGTGFFEAYCPLTGRGTGGDAFSWTAAMWLHWAREKNQ